MADITIDKELILEKLKEYINYEELKREISDIKISKPWDIPKEIYDVIQLVFMTAEKIVTDLGGSSGLGDEKLDAVVSFLDSVIHVPFFLEMLDGPIIRVIVVGMVKILNDLIGHAWVSDDKASIPDTVSMYLSVRRTETA